MKTRNMYFVKYEYPQQIIIDGSALSKNVVGYCTELPTPSEEYPKEWKILDTVLQVAPSTDGNTVMSKTDQTRYSKDYVTMKKDETVDDFFEFKMEDYIYPTKRNVLDWIDAIKSQTEDTQIKDLADKIPSVIYEEEWVGRDEEFNYQKYLLVETIMNRLKEKYGVEDA